MLTRAKQLYGYKGHPHAKFVKVGQYAWQVYKIFANKRNANNGREWLVRNMPQAAPSRVVKTTRGWAVVQLPHAGFRIKATDKKLYKD